jgi:hypothetical protein
MSVYCSLLGNASFVARQQPAQQFVSAATVTMQWLVRRSFLCRVGAEVIKRIPNEASESLISVGVLGQFSTSQDEAALWLYSPILGLDRLHEIFRFILVTTSRTVSRIPWTGDQLVARTLLTTPGDCDDREVGGMNGFGMANLPRRQFVHHKSHLPHQGANLGRRGGKPASNRFSFVAAYRRAIGE